MIGMMFRDVLPATVNELRSLAVLAQRHEVTVVRDVEGRIRIILGTHDPATAPLPDQPTLQAMAAALGARLGAWLSAAPIWLDSAPHPKKKMEPEKRAENLALQLARTYRVPAPWASQASDPSWFLLERHAAKRAWVGEVEPNPPWTIGEVDSSQKPPVLTFFSHKGGVGRSTALVATALHLARAGKKVAVVDLGIEAPGLASLVLPGEPSAGALDYLVDGGVATGTRVSDVTSFVSDTSFVESGPGLQVVSAGPVDDAFLEMLARIDLQDAAASSALAGRIRQLFLDLNASSVDSPPGLGPFDFILVDARAGLHEVAGLMLAGLSHGAVVVATGSPQSWMGVKRVARILSAPYVRSGRDPRPLLLVHGMAPSATDPRHEMETKEFRTKAYDELCADYYPNDQIPDQNDPERPHWPVVIPWSTDLRGGGLLTPPIIEVLMGKPYRELAVRLGRLFGRSLRWSGEGAS
ncbi:hypothetical protein BE21_08400 [Sorangium cellulosum]|uniref:Uncharacterized protein n=1 Tax=Sorangium cellulosum TaxID=56 RepID=A0A150U2K7_SORCE|nr:hypothetical protein BE21_08400 [Sorangium cellulosum]